MYIITTGSWWEKVRDCSARECRYIPREEVVLDWSYCATWVHYSVQYSLHPRTHVSKS